jgi:hypothetical protein
MSVWIPTSSVGGSALDDLLRRKKILVEKIPELFTPGL